MQLTSCCARLLTTFALLAVVGCDSPKGDLGEYTATETTGTDPGTTGTATEDGTTTATGGDPTEDGDPTEENTATSETSGEPDPDTTGDTEGIPMCGAVIEPAEEFVLTLDPPIFDGSFDGDCLVSDGANTHVLTCGDQQVELHLLLNHQPTPLFAAGDTVKFSYRVEMSFASQEWFSIRDAGDNLLLGGLAAERLAPTDEPNFFAPLALAPVEGVCGAPINCDNMFERMAVEATLGADVVQVKAGGFAEFGDPAHDLSVIGARKFHNDLPDGMGGFCSGADIPEYFFQVLLRRVE